MKKYLIAAMITLSSLCAMQAQAASIIPIKRTIQFMVTAAKFNMNEFETITTKNGETFHLHASLEKPNRVLIMDTSWSPIAEFTTTMNEDKGRAAGLEYAKNLGITVELVKPSYYYHNGAYGYAFTVKDLDKADG
ncbi:hypothetical protein [Motilimonas pumila]|uniref:Uncharacterized protein n=1 Tax=Motilimonas pumila TaxID=2303987 RepID=A0A418YDR3_9GAMM|nr:hypothetical protein [Motilimonas pumila]RJG42671.1 hypothetical protein D1Z90_12450 [Motilimonas pumila]